MSISRIAAAFFLISFASFGQISGLATTDDGSVLLFTTSMRLRGTPDGAQGKVVRWDGDFTVLHSVPAQPGAFDARDASGPVVSGDGRTYGYMRPGCGICGFPLVYVRDGVETASLGGARLSHNGRYALGDSVGQGLGNYRFDLIEGMYVEITLPPGDRPLAVSDSGEVLTSRGHQLFLGQPGAQGRLVATAPGNIRHAEMSADGSRVLYVSVHDDLVDLRDGNQVLAALSGQDTNLYVKLSADGSRALVVETILQVSRAYWIDLAAPGRHDLGVVRYGVATISGDGRIAWVASEDGRLTRVTLATGQREAITEAQPVLPPPVVFTSARGSRVRVNGSGLGGVSWQLTFTNGPASVNLPVLETADRYIDFQIPWDLPASLERGWLGIGSADRTFELVRGVLIEPLAPRFWDDPSVMHFIPMKYTTTATLVKAAHRNYDRLVTPGDPAEPGEVLHVYMSGLGPVIPAQANSEPAPVPPPFLTTPLTCELLPSLPARVLFAGLAPGMVGVYQVELEVPQSAAGAERVRCALTLPDQTRNVEGYLPVR